MVRPIIIAAAISALAACDAEELEKAEGRAEDLEVDRVNARDKAADLEARVQDIRTATDDLTAAVRRGDMALIQRRTAQLESDVSDAEAAAADVVAAVD